MTHPDDSRPACFDAIVVDDVEDPDILEWWPPLSREGRSVFEGAIFKRTAAEVAEILVSEKDLIRMETPWSRESVEKYLLGPKDRKKE